MKLLVGLGNPGEKYAKNRHNMGFMLADTVQDQVSRIKGLIVKKPQTFMNASGVEVEKWMRFYKLQPEDLYVAHDDLDIPLGKYKIQKGTGPKLHNGISSIEDALGTNDFWRIRIGVENRAGQKISGEEYVLSDFTEEELKIIHDVIPSIARDLAQRL